MLLDPRIVKMAQVLVGYSLGVQKGWVVTISATPAAMPLVQAACREVVLAGAHPYVLLEPPGVREILLEYGSEEQLTRVDPYQMLMVEKSDAVLRIKSEENTRSANNVDPARQGLYRKDRNRLVRLSCSELWTTARTASRFIRLMPMPRTRR